MFVQAKDRRAIRRCLMRGGFCQVEIGETVRMLKHGFSDRPEMRLPWPFHVLQPHDVRYVELPHIGPHDEWDPLDETAQVPFPKIKDVEESIEKATGHATFGRWQIDAAIDHFLRGVGPSMEVLVVEDDAR